MEHIWRLRIKFSFESRLICSRNSSPGSSNTCLFDTGVLLGMQDTQKRCLGQQGIQEHEICLEKSEMCPFIKREWGHSCARRFITSVWILFLQRGGKIIGEFLFFGCGKSVSQLLYWEETLAVAFMFICHKH